MTDDRGRLSRRRVLGALGGIGAAGALGGTTSALLWDEEMFGSTETPNVLAAGNLDLQVDWTEHYADWRGAETEVSGVRMVDSLDDLESDESPLPYPGAPMLAVDNETLDEFMAATVTESSDLTNDPPPVITLDDVKPGDFGEVTFSYHVFDNPGYVRLCAERFGDTDNGFTEPEDAVDGTVDGSDGTETGDIGDHARAALWYDSNGNNLVDGGEVEVMLVTDVSESMSDEFPGTPTDIDGDTGDGSRLEAVKGIVGEYNGAGFLSDLAASCGDGVEIGTVSTSLDLHHLDNFNDGDDADPDGDGTNEEGFDDGGLSANLDKALGPAGGSDYGELKNVYGTGTAFSPEFVTDDPINNDDFDPANTNDTYVAERPYTENGSSTQTTGVRRAHRALLPDEFTAPSGRVGIDPSGNAAEPGDARKIMIVFLDGSFSDIGDPADTASTLSQKAEQDGIEIQPIVVNPNPSGNAVDFADQLSTDDLDPIFATQYDGTPTSCDSDITDAGFSCSSLDEALATVRRTICGTTGDQIITEGTLNDVLAELDGEECLQLDPAAAGSMVAPEFGGDCTEPSHTGYVALAWWIPRDIPGVNDNIIQSDRYEFQIGFQAEQCRHNTTEELSAPAGAGR